MFPHLAERLPALEDPLTRAVAWSALWESMLAGRTSPQSLLPTLLAVLRSERDEQVASDLLSDLTTLWWRFLAPEQRYRAAQELETLLRAAARGRTGRTAQVRLVHGTPFTGRLRGHRRLAAVSLEARYGRSRAAAGRGG